MIIPYQFYFRLPDVVETFACKGYTAIIPESLRPFPVHKPNQNEKAIFKMEDLLVDADFVFFQFPVKCSEANSQ